MSFLRWPTTVIHKYIYHITAFYILVHKHIHWLCEYIYQYNKIYTSTTICIPWFWPKYSVFLLTSGRAVLSLPVTSSLIPPNARDLGIILGGICIRSRFHSTPCFSVMRGDWGPVWGSCTQKTNPVNSTAKGLVSKQANPFLLPDWPIWGYVNKLMRDPMLMRHVNQKTIAPLSFLRSDWLLPSVAMYTTPSFCSCLLVLANVR